MWLMRVAEDRIVNLDLVAEARWDSRRNDTLKADQPDRIRELVLTLAVPTPASVGASSWSVEGMTVRLRGEVADRAWTYLLSVAGTSCKLL